MKRAWIPALGMAGLCLTTGRLHAAGPGTLHFNNRVLVAGLDAPVYDVDCQTPLGSGFMAQLLAGPAPDRLAPVGYPVPFRDREGRGAGYVSSSEPVSVPTVPAGQVVYVQLQAWSQAPAHYEGPGQPAKIGRSKIFSVETGGDTGQVAGEAIAGFVEVELLPGYSMIGLSLIPPSSRVADLLAGMPDDTLLYLYHADGRGFTVNTLLGEWDRPDEEIRPGMACLVGNPTDDVYRLTFHGLVPVGELRRSLPAGWSLQALPLPYTGRLDADLHCPIRDLELIARWDAWPAELRFLAYNRGRWYHGGTTQGAEPPVLHPGEGFWIWKNAPEDWSIRFTPPP